MSFYRAKLRMNLRYQDSGFFLTNVKKPQDSTKGFRRVRDGVYMSSSLKSAIQYADYASDAIKARLKQIEAQFGRSYATEPYANSYTHPSEKFFPYQQAGINLILDRLKNKKSVLLADEMGLGKTVQAIGAVNELGLDKMLILCPAIAKYNWLKFLKRWYLDPSANIQIVNGKDNVDTNADVIIINYDIYHREAIFQALKSMKFPIIIADEGHYLKDIDAKRTAALYGENGLIHYSDKLINITGTPITNKTVDIHPFLRATAPEVIKPYLSYYDFAVRYAGARSGVFGFQLGAATNTDDLKYRLRGSLMIRRLKKDVLKDLPDKTYDLINFESDFDFQNKEKETFKDFKTDYTTLKMLIEENFEQLSESGQSHHMAAMAELRKLSTAWKYQNCLSWIHQSMSEIPKMVLFAHHRETIKTLTKDLAQYNPITIYGGVTAEQKFELAERFQNDNSVRLAICNIAATGVAIDLTAASHVAFAEVDWSSSNIKQAIDRCHRIGQKNAVNVYFLSVLNSMDSYLMRAIIKKQRDIDKTID